MTNKKYFTEKETKEINALANSFKKKSDLSKITEYPDDLLEAVKFRKEQRLLELDPIEYDDYDDRFLGI